MRVASVLDHDIDTSRNLNKTKGSTDNGGKPWRSMTLTSLHGSARCMRPCNILLIANEAFQLCDLDRSPSVGLSTLLQGIHRSFQPEYMREALRARRDFCAFVLHFLMVSPSLSFFLSFSPFRALSRAFHNTRYFLAW
jgi:hypothetical protein